MDKGKMAGVLAMMALLGFMGAFAFMLANQIPGENKDLVAVVPETPGPPVDPTHELRPAAGAG